MSSLPSRCALPTLSMLGVGVIGSLVLMTLPILVAGMVARFNLGEREIGWLAATDMAGSAVASLACLRYIARINWRTAAWLAITVVIIGNLLSTQADGFVTLAAARFLAGAANGVLLSIAFVGLCHSSDPDRYFGFYTFAQLALQALALWLLPMVLAAHGLTAVFVILASASALSALLVRTIPVSLASAANPPAHVPPDVQQDRIHGAARRGILIALAGQAAYFVAPAAVWAYLEPIGSGFALTGVQIGRALGIASLAAMVGALAVIFVGVRVSRMVLMSGGTLLSLMALVLLHDGSGFVRYLVAASVFNFAWNFTFPYQMGVLASFDSSGSVAIHSLLVQLFGLALGPLFASALLIGERFSAILWACGVCYVLSLFMFAASMRLAPPAAGSVETTT